MIDLNLLRILKHREDFYKVRGRVPEEVLEERARIILSDFSRYFKKFPDHALVDIPIFTTLFRAWHSSLSKEAMIQYVQLLSEVSKDVPDENKDAIIENMLELRLSSSVATLLAQFEDGEVPNLHSRMTALFDEHQRDANITGIDFIRTDIGDLLNDDGNDAGLHWRMDCLNACMRPLRGGDFLILAGRPGKGKTTFIASEVTYMAPQILGERTIVWLNNEGPGERIKQRLYQAALGIRLSAMIEMHAQGKLQQTYDDLMGMVDRIRVFDIHGMDLYAVERIVESNSAAVVVYDMIDKIKGFGDAARTDLGLEAMYDWARELGVKHDVVGIATSQISAEGSDNLFPPDSALKDSKTGKQGACDVIIMIGTSESEGMQSIRGIGVPKNKLQREGVPSDPKTQVQFKPGHARFSDVPVPIEDDEHG